MTVIASNNSYFCDFSLLDTTKNVGLGAAAFLVEYPTTLVSHTLMIRTMESYGFNCSAKQDAIDILEGLGSIGSSAFSASVLKTAWMAYIVFFGPILEEIVFRGLLHRCIEIFQGDQVNELTAKVSRVVLNGILFGAFHISPAQGWLNLPLFITLSFLGIVDAALREYTGNIVAPITTHCLHNSMSMFLYLNC